MVALVLAVVPDRLAAAPSQQDAWTRAVALMRARQPEAAIPLLEAVVRQAPGSTAARLELALALFQTGRDRRARREFRTALAGEPTALERRAAQHYMARIERRRVWRFGFSGAFVPQSNVSRRSTLETVIIGGTSWTLNERVESGIGARLHLSAGYHPQLAPDLRGRVVVSLSGTAYERRAWNDYTMALDAALERAAGRDRLWIAGVVARHRWIGDKAFSLEAGLQGSHHWQVASRTRVTLRGEAVRRHHPHHPGRDGSALRLAGHVSHDLSPTLTLHGGLSLGRTWAGLDYENSTIGGVELGATLRAGSGWRLGLNLSHLAERRSGPTPVFGIARRESEQRIRMRVSKADLNWRGFAPELELGHERRRSNVPVFGWSNNFIGLVVTRSF